MRVIRVTDSLIPAFVIFCVLAGAAGGCSSDDAEPGDTAGDAADVSTDGATTDTVDDTTADAADTDDTAEPMDAANGDAVPDAGDVDAASDVSDAGDIDVDVTEDVATDPRPIDVGNVEAFETSEDACLAWVEARCEHIDDPVCEAESEGERAFYEANSQIDECEDGYAYYFCGVWLGSELREYLEIDLQAAAECVAVLDAWSCTEYYSWFFIDLGEDHPCRQILEPTQSEGDPCFNNVSCSDGTYCYGGLPPRYGVGPLTAGTPGDCRPPADVGAECTANYHCLEGLWCNRGRCDEE